MSATLAAAIALFSSAPAAAQSAETGIVRVPVAPPSITIISEGERAPVWREPPVSRHNEIFLRGFNADPPPANVEAAISRVRAALPPDYLHALLREFGYRPGRRAREIRSGRTSLREFDLARFLFHRWVDADPRTRLAREFHCLSWGEFDIGVFLTLVAAAEARSGTYENEVWRLDPAAERFRLATEANQNARTAWWACTRLAERGEDSGARTEE